MRIFLLSAIVIFALWVFWQIFSTPVMIRQWGTENCLRVESLDPKLNCENPPKRYILEWRI